MCIRDRYAIAGKETDWDDALVGKKVPKSGMLSVKRKHGDGADACLQDVHTPRRVHVLLTSAEEQRRRLRGIVISSTRAAATPGRSPPSCPPRRREPRARRRELTPGVGLRAVPRDHHAVHTAREPRLQRAFQRRRSSATTASFFSLPSMSGFASSTAFLASAASLSLCRASACSGSGSG